MVTRLGGGSVLASRGGSILASAEEHMVSKFERVAPAEHKHGSRLAIVFSGSPLFTGGAGSGESDIRKWIIQNDWLDAVIGLPEQMFYNTGIGTYVWIVTNRKEKRRKGKIQLIDAREFFIPMRRSQGDKRRKIGEGEDGEPNQIADVVRLYGQFEQNERSKIFDNDDFGYTRVTVERPLRLRYQMTIEEKARFLDACPELLDDIQAIDTQLGREPLLDWNQVWSGIQTILRARNSRWKTAEQKLFRSVFTVRHEAAEKVLVGNRGDNYEPDSDSRDFENVPLKVDVDAYFQAEVLPHVTDAWMDRSKDKVGFEINFNRHFYRFTPPRTLAEIDGELKIAEEEVLRLLKEVVA